MENERIDGIGHSAAMHGAEVVLARKIQHLERDLLHTGGTRCNVTNRRTPEEIVKHIPGKWPLLIWCLYKIWKSSGYYSVLREYDVRLKRRRKITRAYVGDGFGTKTILETFIQEVSRVMQVRTNVKVKTIRVSDGPCEWSASWIMASSVEADAVILATRWRILSKTRFDGTGMGLQK